PPGPGKRIAQLARRLLRPLPAGRDDARRRERPLGQGGPLTVPTARAAGTGPRRPQTLAAGRTDSSPIRMGRLFIVRQRRRPARGGAGRGGTGAGRDGPGPPPPPRGGARRGVGGRNIVSSRTWMP